MHERIIANTQFIDGYIVPPSVGENAQVGFSKKKAAEQLAQKIGNNTVAFQYEGKFYTGQLYPTNNANIVDNTAINMQSARGERGS